MSVENPKYELLIGQVWWLPDLPDLSVVVPWETFKKAFFIVGEEEGCLPLSLFKNLTRMLASILYIL